MKTFHYSHSLLLMLLLAAGSITEAWAYDKDEDPPLEYAYDHTLEIQLGTGANLNDYSQLPDQGIALFGSDIWGFDFNFRYTRFFSRHWGAYAQLNALALNADNDYLEQPLRQHYNHGGKEVRMDNCWEDECFNFGLAGDCGSDYVTGLLGVTYRYDAGRWSFRPRLGLGLLLQSDSSYDGFYVIDTNTQDTYEWVKFTFEDRPGHAYHSIPAFAYSPAFQLTFSTSNHFFISAEVQWMGTIGHAYQHTVSEQFRTELPQDWDWDSFHSNGGFCLRNPSHFVQKTDDHRDRLQMGNFIQFRIGVGFNIGHNRNEKSFRSTR